MKNKEAEMFTDWCKWNCRKINDDTFEKKWKLTAMLCYARYWDRGLQKMWLKYIKFDERYKNEKQTSGDVEIA